MIRPLLVQGIFFMRIPAHVFIGTSYIYIFNSARERKNGGNDERAVRADQEKSIGSD